MITYYKCFDRGKKEGGTAVRLDSALTRRGLDSVDEEELDDAGTPLPRWCVKDVDKVMAACDGIGDPDHAGRSLWIDSVGCVSVMEPDAAEECRCFHDPRPTNRELTAYTSLSNRLRLNALCAWK